MEHDNTTTEAPKPKTTTRELVRPREGRVIAGVAAALANRFDLPVWLFRALFVILTFAGGLGLAPYAAGWFLIRSEDEADTPAERLLAGTTASHSWIGLGLVFVAVLILLDNFTFLSGGIVWAVGLLVAGVLLYTGDLPRLIGVSGSKEGVQTVTTNGDPASAMAGAEDASGGSTKGGGPSPTPTPILPTVPPASPKRKEVSFLGRLTIGSMLLGTGILAVFDNTTSLVEPEPRHYLALAVTILGLGLMIGAFAGRARWLILLGVVLVPTLIFSPVFEWDWTSDTFNRTVIAQSFDELESTYSIDVGNLVIDLTELPWNGEEIEVIAGVDAGNIEVRVPAEVQVTGVGTVNVGRVAGFGQESAGLGEPTVFFEDTGSRGIVRLELSVDIGNIEVFED